MKTKILSPEGFYGFQIGADRKLARWDKIVEYFWHLNKSPCVKVTKLGKSTMGNPFLLAVISSPENIKNLERLREISLRFSHPKGLSEEELEKLIAEGKTVVSMTMSVHASEIGGTQMSSELAYELTTSDDPEIRKIRENTVFLLVPCSNPDGNIMVVDWYNKWLGTEYEGCGLPWLYNKYVGHDNNRDAFHITQIESKMLTHLLYKEWYPQAQMDFHHTGSYGARFCIPPHTDPLYEYVDPLIWAEQQLYGGAMLIELEAAGKTGIETQGTYPGDMSPAWDDSPCLHNICGMLTESASAKLATPMYVHYQQLGPARRGRPEYRVMTTFPHPWPEGWWRLRDIVEQQKIASIALLKCAANYRERILRNMYLKAKRQIEAGESEPPYAFIVSPRQHDPLTTYKLLQTLQAADIEVHRVKEAFEVDGVTYPEGTYVIFTSQTCRPYILKLLKQTFYHDGPLTRRPDGTPMPPFDLSTDTLAEFMGVRLVEVLKPLKGSFELCDLIEFPRGRVDESKYGYLLDGRLNESFAVVNSLLKKGIEVHRILKPVGDLPVGTFYIPSKEGLERGQELAERHHVVFQAAESADFEMKPVKPLRIGMYRRYWGGNMDEGWNRWLFEQYGFEYKTLWDAEIKEGNLAEKYDVIVLPNDPKCLILGEGIEEYYRKTRPKYVMPKYPPEFRSGIGKEGMEKLHEFVEAGGTLITLGAASDLAIEELKLPIKNVIKNVEPKEFLCPGSTLKVNIDMAHSLAHGVAEDCLILFWRNYAIFEIEQGASNEDYRVVVSYPEERILQSGWLIGEKYFSNKAALIEAKLGKGRVILFGFRPQFRAKTAATFKFLFNCLLG